MGVYVQGLSGSARSCIFQCAVCCADECPSAVADYRKDQGDGLQQTLSATWLNVYDRCCDHRYRPLRLG